MHTYIHLNYPHVFRYRYNVLVSMILIKYFFPHILNLLRSLPSLSVRLCILPCDPLQVFPCHSPLAIYAPLLAFLPPLPLFHIIAVPYPCCCSAMLCYASLLLSMPSPCLFLLCSALSLYLPSISLLPPLLNPIVYIFLTSHVYFLRDFPASTLCPPYPRILLRSFCTSHIDIVG